jgi:hypothetical protein
MPNTAARSDPTAALAENSVRPFLIEPLSQSDRAIFKLLLFRLTGTLARVVVRA